MNVATKKQHALLLAALLLASLVIRLVLFCGFVLGDDPAYADFAAQILHTGYPHIGTHGVFACRPIVLYAISLCIWLFGWFDGSFVLPVLCASLLNAAIVYLAAARLGGMTAAFFAAAAYIVFPLDAVHATTMSNDIMLSAFVWGGGLLLLFSLDGKSRRAARALAAVSGFMVGAGVAVKFNAVVAPALFVGLALLYGLRRDRRGIYGTLPYWLAGWLAANACLCLFLYAKSGDFLAHYHCEMRFNLDYNPSGYTPGGLNLVMFLLRYPLWMLGLATEGHAGYTFLPYGYFFLAFFLCAPLCLFRRFRALRLPALCALFYLLVMEFSPLKLSPYYEPIHRLPRFLHIAAIPAAVTVGLACGLLVSAGGRAIKVLTVAAFALLVATSLSAAWTKAFFYRDCALDLRWAWNAVKHAPAKKIITDPEMRNYLMFRSGFRPPWPILSPPRIPKLLPAGALIITGGARRPDMVTTFAQSWLHGRRLDAGLGISEAPFALRPWRPTRLAVYKTSGPVRLDAGRGSGKARHRSAADGLVRVGQLDVGDSASERQLQYRIHKQTWQGSRDFAYRGGGSCTDEGRAHRGFERLVLKHLRPGKPLVIIKRFDPAVAGQIVAVTCNGGVAGLWDMVPDGAAGPNTWQESSFVVPGSLITGPAATLRLAFQASVFDVNSFYYWFYQER